MFAAKSLVNTTDDHAIRLGGAVSSKETPVRRIERHIEERYLFGGDMPSEEVGASAKCVTLLSVA